MNKIDNVGETNFALNLKSSSLKINSKKASGMN